MTRHTGPALPDTPAAERGSVAAYAATIVLAFILAVGLVVDGGAKLQAIEHAQGSAEHAARVAAQNISGSVLRGQRPALASSKAVALGQEALSVEGVAGTITVNGNTVTVESRATSTTTFLSLIGINSVSGTGRATARVAVGITTEVP